MTGIFRFRYSKPSASFEHSFNIRQYQLTMTTAGADKAQLEHQRDLSGQLVLAIISKLPPR
jgi:hypothetical protein